ncbi:MAG TPA: HAD family phosphatase [Terriglobia bacterium]|nr:HAD family phosphatase [Terriglobia bacterium]
MLWAVALRLAAYHPYYLLMGDITELGAIRQDKRAEGEKKIRVCGVIFDYGNVLCTPQLASDRERMAETCGLGKPRFDELYWRFRLAYDRHDLDGDSYWKAIAGAEGRTLSREEITKLILLDSQSWARPNEPVLKWTEQLRGAGLRLAVLSNMPFEVSRYLLENCPWLGVFHHLIFSCDEASAKPDPAIYRTCLSALEMRPEEVLFLDDRPENVSAALKLGMRSLVFDTPEEASAVIARQFDLPALIHARPND